MITADRIQWRVGVTLGLALLAAVGRAAPAPVVQAALVAAESAIVPDRPVLVALRLSHPPRVHTYWSNPGTGVATSLRWDLPAGWSAGPIQWPEPQVLPDGRGQVVGQGYEGEVLLPVVLTPPPGLKPGATVELRAKAEWLMCDEACVPGGAPVALTLPVSASSSTDTAYGDSIRRTVAALPRADDAWRVSAVAAGSEVILTLAPTGSKQPDPGAIHFFPEDDFIAYDLPQSRQTDEQGRIVIRLPRSPDGPAGPRLLRGVAVAQHGWVAGASWRGLKIEAELSPPLQAVAAANGKEAAAAAGGLPGTLLLAFLGGLVLNLMPCVFPVLGIKILGFVNQAGHQRARIVAHGLAFTGGVLLSFWLLAGALAVLRAGGSQLGWGFQLQSPAFVYALAVLLLVFALNMSGVFEFGLRATAMVSNAPWVQRPKSQFVESFLTGVLATAVATPCSAPFLAPALGAALAVSTAESMVIFTAIALGLSTPYLLLSLFPQAVRILPRPGVWMETFKQAMAFPLYATVGYLAWVLAGQTSEEGLRGVLLSFALIGLAVWMYGRWNAAGATTARVRIGVAGLVLFGSVGLWLGWPRETAAGPGGSGAATQVVWEPWSPEAVQRLRAEGRTVYVDFTARWCATCQTNKKLVFGSADVVKTFADKKVATLRADWTSRDPRITAELAAYRRSAVPFNLIWKPGAEAPVVMPEILTPAVVMEAIDARARPNG